MPLGRWSFISSSSTRKCIYYANFNSVTKYGIIFWVVSSNSGKISTVQNKIVMIMAGAQPRTFCRSLSKQLEILRVPRQ